MMGRNAVGDGKHGWASISEKDMQSQLFLKIQ